MAEQKIELRRIRDFGENISDTLLFIKQNLKPLVSSFFAIAGIFLLANAVISGFYQSQHGNVFQAIFSGRIRTNQSINPMFSGLYFLLPLLGFFSANAMHVSIISYVKVYELKQGEAPTIEEVWETFKKYYFKVLLYSIPLYLLIIVGMVFCLIPGIYFLVVLLPFPVVVIVEDQSFSGAFSRCFEIIKKNFWLSLGIYFVVGLIYSFASGIISVVMGGIAGALSYLSTGDISKTIGIATSVLSALSFVFYIVFYVAIALHYFTLAEKFDGTGMMRRIDTLGDNRPDHDNLQEQY